MIFDLLHKDPIKVAIADLENIKTKLAVLGIESHDARDKLHGLIMSLKLSEPRPIVTITREPSELRKHLMSIRELVSGSLHELEEVEKLEKKSKL
jgi:hypothetical protein